MSDVLIAGRRRAGKDTLGDIIKETTHEKGVRVNFADSLKQIYCENNKVVLTSKNKESHRLGLINLGQDMRKGDLSFWAKKLRLNHFHDDVIVADWRFPEEDVPFSDALKVLVLASDNSRTKRGWSFKKSVDEDISETSMVDYPDFNIVLVNDGSISDLREQWIKSYALWLECGK